MYCLSRLPLCCRELHAIGVIVKREPTQTLRDRSMVGCPSRSHVVPGEYNTGRQPARMEHPLGKVGSQLRYPRCAPRIQGSSESCSRVPLVANPWVRLGNRYGSPPTDRGPCPSIRIHSNHRTLNRSPRHNCQFHNYCNQMCHSFRSLTQSHHWSTTSSRPVYYGANIQWISPSSRRTKLT